MRPFVQKKPYLRITCSPAENEWIKLTLDKTSQQLTGYVPGTRLEVKFNPRDKLVGVLQSPSGEGRILDQKGSVFLPPFISHWFRRPGGRLYLMEPAHWDGRALTARFPQVVDDLRQYTIPFSEYVRAYCERHNISKCALARLAHVDQNSVYRILHSRTITASEETVRRLRIAMGLPPESIFRDTDLRWRVDPSMDTGLSR